MTRLDDLHYGERLGDLLPVFTQIAEGLEPVDGGFVLDVTFPPDVALPFARAMHRAEAEILLEDADALTDLVVRAARTPEQRGFDALMRIVDGFRVPAEEVLDEMAKFEPKPTRRYRRHP